jgi:eukaryotic-like serine/threonine-protein kinase
VTQAHIDIDVPVSPAQEALDRLLWQMREKSDFPALSDSVVRIQRVVNSESVSLSGLTDEILKDVALTNKLLRIVNSAHYASVTGGSSAAGGGDAGVSTVSRAVALVGFSGIRDMAMSLVLLEHMHDKQHAKQIQAEFLRALMAGALADELSRFGRDSEEAFIGAMFSSLGRLLTQYYLPEQAQAIRDRLANSIDTPSKDLTGTDAHTSASRHVLGLSFEELGLGVAKAWGLPPALVRCMQRTVGEPPNKPAEKGEDRVRWLAVAANQMTDALLEADPQVRQLQVDSIAKRYRRALGCEVADFDAAASRARARITEMAAAMNLSVEATSPSRRLLLDASPPSGTPASEVSTSSATPRQRPPAHAIVPAEVLASGVRDITYAMVERFRPDDVLRKVIETMLRALHFRRVLLCFRDEKGESLVGRIGVGEQDRMPASAFKVALKGGTDLFAVVCNKGVDTLISDASVTNIAARLPEWYRLRINAPTFLLLPMQLEDRPLGLVYADKTQAGSIDLAEKELDLLRTLRNQALMAFRQLT